ncbi:MAG: hypothetical protein ACRYG7_38100 [Janthinobacterium lividum]
MKASLLLCLAVMLRVSVAHAQPESGVSFWPGFYKYKSVALISQQPLVVLLSEEDPKKLKKLANKPEELAEYKASIAYLNTKLQKLAPQVWKFSPSVEFKSESALPALQAAPGQRTVVLYYEKQAVGVSRQHVGFGPKDGMWQAILQLSSLGDGKEQLECSALLPLDIIYPSDIVVAFKQIQHQLRRDVKLQADAGLGHDKQLQVARDRLRAEGDANAESIRTKLLLVAQDDVDEGLTEEDIKRVYPFPFQLVPRTTIEEAVRVSDIRYNYVRWRAASMASTGPEIIAAADGQVLGCSADGGLGLRGQAIIGKREFKDFARYADAKVSRLYLGIN